MDLLNCKICNKETTKGKMYCSNSCKNKQHYINNSEKYKNIPSTSKRLRETFKTLALDYCGNKCKMCGYNKRPHNSGRLWSPLILTSVGRKALLYEIVCFIKSEVPYHLGDLSNWVTK